jgi:hypothetical protein
MHRRHVFSLLVLVVLGLAACGSEDTKLKVTGIEPEQGDVNGGQFVQVSGNGFITPARSAKIYFGNRQGTVSRFASNNLMIVEAPGGKAGEKVDVLIIFEPGGEIRIPHAFEYVEKDTTVPSVNDLNINKTK